MVFCCCNGCTSATRQDSQASELPSLVLSTGAVLQVTVCESHTIAGGAAHTWQRDGYHFESGPSLYSGMETGKGKEGNPLAHVLEAIGEPLELIQYNTWNVIVPEGQFLTKVCALALALALGAALPAAKSSRLRPVYIIQQHQWSLQ
jgi:hypothetical protein